MTACLLWLAAPLALHAAALVAVPPLTGPVVDTTRSLAPAQASALDAQARQLQADKGVQLQVLMLPTTGDEDIAAYATRVFEAWKLGNQKTDNGVLVLVAKDDRRARIEVGYGLEGTLTDAQTSEIIRNTMVPFFKTGDFGGGLVAGTGQLVTLIRAGAGDGVASAAPASAQRPTSGASNIFLTLAVVGFFCFFGWAFLSWLFRPLRMLALAVLGGGLGWMLMPTFLTGGLGALIGLALGWLRLDTAAGGRVARSSLPYVPVNTPSFDWGGGGGGGGWSSGGGGGGWSGGGGSSGGGGASGSW